MSAPAHKPILLLGSDGMLGRAFSELLRAQNIPFEAKTLPEFDLTRPQSIHAALSPNFRAVINCAAHTDVDGAESNEALSIQINASGVGELANACREHQLPLVHFSTDYVFSGDADSPYLTNAPRAPINAYGRAKLLGEQLLEQSKCEYLLIRTSWLYAPWAKNFVRTIAAAARNRPELKVVHDQRGRPTSAQHLAATTLALVNRQARGTYHITDGGECTWFDFATEIVRVTNAPCKVTPCTTDEFPRPAKRPAYSVLDIAKTESELGPMPAWQTNLSEVIAKLEH